MKGRSAIRFALIPAIIAWGVFPFGAVHPWAYWPLIGLILLTSAWYWMASSVRLGVAALAIAALVIVPTALQLVPLSTQTLQSIAPVQYSFLAQIDPLISLAATQSHPLSIAPYRTTLTLVFLATGVIWTAALATALGNGLRPSTVVRQVMAVGVVVAILGLVQKATFNGKIYWVWQSQFGASDNYFGPFVNRNHFAGWMLLAVAVSAGYFLGQLRRVAPEFGSWRQRVLWLGTPDAGKVMITAAVLATLAVSLVWTLSRSGMIAFACAMMFLTAIAGVRMPGKARRWATALSLMGVVLLVAGWVGVEVLSSKYSDTRNLEWRFDLWRDSTPLVRKFVPFGAGMNAYGTAMLLVPQTDLTVHAQQAHNDYLQLAVEGSLLVGLPLLAAAVLLTRKAWLRFQQPQDDMTWWIRLGAVAGVFGMAIQELTEFSLQIPGVAALFCVLVALAVHQPSALLQGALSKTSRRPIP